MGFLPGFEITPLTSYNLNQHLIQKITEFHTKNVCKSLQSDPQSLGICVKCEWLSALSNSSSTICVSQIFFISRSIVGNLIFSQFKKTLNSSVQSTVFSTNDCRRRRFHQKLFWDQSILHVQSAMFWWHFTLDGFPLVCKRREYFVLLLYT